MVNQLNPDNPDQDNETCRKIRDEAKQTTKLLGKDHNQNNNRIKCTCESTEGLF